MPTRTRAYAFRVSGLPELHELLGRFCGSDDQRGAPVKPLLLVPAREPEGNVRPDLVRELGMSTTAAYGPGLGAGGTLEVSFARAKPLALGAPPWPTWTSLCRPSSPC